MYIVTQKSCVIAVKLCTLTFKLTSILHALPEPMEKREWKNFFNVVGRTMARSDGTSAFSSSIFLSLFQLSPKKDVE